MNNFKVGQKYKYAGQILEITGIESNTQGTTIYYTTPCIGGTLYCELGSFMAENMTLVMDIDCREFKVGQKPVSETHIEYILWDKKYKQPSTLGYPTFEAAESAAKERIVAGKCKSVTILKAVGVVAESPMTVTTSLE